MSGLQCADFGGSDIANNLCLLPAGTPYEGLVTHRDGRVATLAESAGVAGRNDALNADMQGAEIGDCGAQGLSVSFSPLQSNYQGTAVAWTPANLRALHTALGQRPGQSGNAFFCADPANARNLVINSAITYRPTVIGAIGALTENRAQFQNELDDLHYNAALQSLRTIAGIPEPESLWDKIKGAAVYMFGGVSVFAVGGLAAHILGKWWDGRGGPGGRSGVGSDRSARGWIPPENPRPGQLMRRESHTGFWAGVAVVCGVAAVALVADDATGIGVVDDPLAVGFAIAGRAALRLSSF